MKKLRILLAGGGTGGHIFPLIAVAEELKNQSAGFGVDLDLRYFGSARSYAQTLVDNDIEYAPIMATKWRRYFSILNFLDIIKFPFSILQLLWKMFLFMPNVIFSKGGPGALAVVLVGKFYRIPVVIHESDSLPGLTNKISSRWAKKVFLSFAVAGQYFQNQNQEIVGNPVRQSLFAAAESLRFGGENPVLQAKKGLGLGLNEPTLLILGGSQGAERLNDFVLENLELLIQDFRVLHQIGKNNYENYKKELEFVTKDWGEMEKNRYHYRSFFDKDLADALLAADIVIARAGAGSIFELAAFGKPAILVPLPESANDHQKENARIYSEAGACVVIQEENLMGNIIKKALDDLTANPLELKAMGDAARSFYRPDSAAIIAKYLLTYV